MLTKITVTFITIIIMFNISTYIFGFAGISFSSYGAYLFWISAIALFYVFLPQKQSFNFLE